jgi:hypothetical protein
MLISSRRQSVATVATLALAAVASAGGQTERRSLSGDQVAIYNIAGKVRVQAGPDRKSSSTSPAADVTAASSRWRPARCAAGNRCV